jgi:hypothetical protein
MKPQVKALWEDVLRFALLDSFVAAVVTLLAFGLASLAWSIGRPSAVSLSDIRSGAALLGMLYWLAILLVAASRHFRIAWNRSTSSTGKAGDQAAGTGVDRVPPGGAVDS